MEYERSQTFNERLSQWVASEGFWFQLRYSMGGGNRGTFTYHLLRMGMRLLVLLLIATVGGWIYLMNRTSGDAFREQTEASLSAALGASDSKLGGVMRSAGELNINRFVSLGGPETFFSTLQARVITARMGMLDGVRGTWDPGTVSINQFDIHLHAGADDADAAENISRIFFQKHERLSLNAVRVNTANIRWGGIDQGGGAIEGSRMTMQRVVNGWRLEFTGGLFTHGWLRQLEIDRLTIICTPDGLRFEAAEFRQGSGTVDLGGLTIAGGPSPEVSGRAIIRRLPLTHALPVAVRDFAEGSFSADLRVFGSTNSAEGVGFEGEVRLEGADSITLRDRIHLLRALSVVDAFHNYRNVDFREGGFNLKVSGGGVEITNVDMKAGDLMHIRGGMNVLPVSEGDGGGSAGSSGSAVPTIFSGGDDLFDLAERSGGGELSGDYGVLSDDARERARTASADSTDLFDRVSSSVEFRLRAEQALALVSKSLAYEGNVRVSLGSDAFERAEALKRAYPVDPASGRIPFDVPLSGNLFDLTLEQAEDFYRRGRR